MFVGSFKFACLQNINLKNIITFRLLPDKREQVTQYTYLLNGIYV